MTKMNGKYFCSASEQYPVQDLTTDLFLPGSHICSPCYAEVFSLFFFNDSSWYLTISCLVILVCCWNIWNKKYQPSRSLTYCIWTKYFVSHRLMKSWLRWISQMHLWDSCWKTSTWKPDIGFENRTLEPELEWGSQLTAHSLSGEYHNRSHPLNRGAIEILTTRSFYLNFFFDIFLSRPQLL